MNQILNSASPVISGDAKGTVMLGSSALSFWGGVDAHSGCVVDRRHNLYGRCMTGHILVLPRGAGSCSTTGIMLEMIRIQTQPAAIICLDAEPLLCMASVIGKSLYERLVPVYTVTEADYALLTEGAEVSIAANQITIVNPAL